MEEVSTEIAKTERTAADYVNAANAVIDLAEIAVSLIPGGGTVAQVAAKAVKYAPVARQVVGKLPDVAPIAKQAAGALQEKAPDAINVGAGKVFGAMKGAASSVGEKGSAVGSAIHNAAEARAQEKARKEARRVLLDGAGIRMSVGQFLENWETQQRLSAQADDGYLSYCGCYAIATYASAVKKDDYGSFRDIFIGKSTDMGSSIHADITGRGNIDVYADVKYKQHVYVLLFPCTEDKLDKLERSLIVALDADASYNKGNA